MLYPNYIIGAFMSSGSISEDRLFLTVYNTIKDELLSQDTVLVDKAVNFARRVLGWRCFFVLLNMDGDTVSYELCQKFYFAMKEELIFAWKQIGDSDLATEQLDASLESDIYSKSLLFFRSIPKKYVSVDGSDFAMRRDDVPAPLCGSDVLDFIAYAPFTGVFAPDILSLMSHKRLELCASVTSPHDIISECLPVDVSLSFSDVCSFNIDRAFIFSRLNAVRYYLESACLSMFTDEPAAELIQLSMTKSQMRAFYSISSLILNGDIVNAYILFYEFLRSFCKRPAGDLNPVDCLVDSMGLTSQVGKLTYGEYFFVKDLLYQFIVSLSFSRKY